jgi:hypothetical protein
VPTANRDGQPSTQTKGVDEVIDLATILNCEGMQAQSVAHTPAAATCCSLLSYCNMSETRGAVVTRILT